MTSQKALNDRLTRTEKNQTETPPTLALEKGWYKDRDFCQGFFERCEHRILKKAPEALTMAHRAAEMAEYNGDQHLKNLSHGLLVHAFIADSLYIWATNTLESYRASALSCCPRCQGDYYLRKGDLLGEMGFPEKAIEALDTCLKVLGNKVKPDYLGRVYFLRAVANNFEGHRALALRDAGEALMHFALDSPRGFFLDAIAFIGVFLGGDDPSDDELALAQLSRFQKRIKGLNKWSDVRARMSWVEGQVFARLDNLRRAREHLEKAAARIVPNALTREAVAVTLDACQLRLRHEVPNNTDIGIARRLLKSCLEHRSDLPPKQEKALKELVKLLKTAPEKAFRALGALRASFVAPVPNRFEEKLRPSA